MNKQDIIKSICEMPVKFKAAGDVSILELFDRSGYCDTQIIVTESDLENILLANPDLIPAWLEYSEDNRSSNAPYIMYKNRRWFVGAYPNEKEIAFKDQIKACSSYIKRYIECLSAVF